jgi:hypothetical protein
MKTCAVVFAVLMALAGSATADPWKDESGKRGWRGAYGYEHGYAPRLYGDRYRPRRERHREAIRIPPGHLPPPGECRDWYPGGPPDHQRPPYKC